MKAVRSSTSDQPLIISRNPRSKNLLQCKCKTDVWHLICEHALAAALNLGITFDYLAEVKTKILTSRKSKDFTKAVNMNPIIKKKVWKKARFKTNAIREWNQLLLKGKDLQLFLFPQRLRKGLQPVIKWYLQEIFNQTSNHFSPDSFYQTPNRNRHHKLFHLLVNNLLYRQASSRFLTLPMFWLRTVHWFGTPCITLSLWNCRVA